MASRGLLRQASRAWPIVSSASRRGLASTTPPSSSAPNRGPAMAVAAAGVGGALYYMWGRNKGDDNSAAPGSAQDTVPPVASAPAELAKDLKDKLAEIVGEGAVNVDDESLVAQGKPGFSYHHIDRHPDVIVTPTSTEQISEIVKLCAQHKIPVIPYGGGTSLEGQLLAPGGGVSLDMSQMNQVLHFNKGDLDITVQPGLGYVNLNEFLAEHKMWFPLDPGPGAFLGGMAACRCSGSTAVRYGTMRENVVSMTVVTADGRIVKTGGRAKKSAAGYDLTRLFVGSEGTLGVITELTLKVFKVPSHATAMRASFNSIEAAAAVVQETLSNGIQIGRAEMMDESMIKVLNEANGTKHAEVTTLLFEFTGESSAAVRDMQDRVTAIAKKYKPVKVTVSTDPKQSKEMWRERKEALWSTEAVYPDKECMITDVCVPVSRLAELIGESKKELGKSWLPAPLVAHAGDGNFHAFIMFDPKEPKELAEAKRLSHYMVQKAIEMEGTCTGEHGVGTGKVKYLQEEFGKATLQTMGDIKRALDPDNIMNPGKILEQRTDPKTGRLTVCS